MTDETKKPDETAPPAAEAKPAVTPAPAAEVKPATPAAAAPVAPKPAAAAAPVAAKPAAPAHKGPTARVAVNALFDAVSAKLGDKVEGMPSFTGEATLKVKALADLPATLQAAQLAGANYLSDLTSAHYPAEKPPFEIVYHTYNLATNQPLRIKARLEDSELIPTAIPIWPGANWMEREVFDLMGLKFSGHPDLRRILTPEDWDWSPLRKEFNRFGPDWVNKLRGGEARMRYDERGIHYAKATAPEAFIEEPPAPKPAPVAKPAAPAASAAAPAAPVVPAEPPPKPEGN